MNLREKTELYEKENLSTYACLSIESKGRLREEEKCPVRTDFQRDRDRIIHSKAFRRLMHKTQVFLSPEGDHYRTRLTHTIEVSQIARTISRALSLNEDLTEAIALGHDLGHTPFGHSGESILNKIHPGGFKHNEQSLRVVDFLEKKNNSFGLNLTFEVRDGIVNHSGTNRPATLEGQVVKLSDRIAYLNHDVDDAIRAGVLTYDMLPKEYIKTFGNTVSNRINSMILSVIENTTDEIKMSDYENRVLIEFRKFMFEKVYLNEIAKGEEQKAKYIIEHLYKFYLENPEILFSEHECLDGDSINVSAKDYIAGMSDRYIVNKYKELFIPDSWK